jgi:hypothetical protein
MTHGLQVIRGPEPDKQRFTTLMEFTEAFVPRDAATPSIGDPAHKKITNMG